MRLFSLPELQAALSAPGRTHAYLLVDCALHREWARQPPMGVASAVLEVPGVEDAESRAVLPRLLAWPEDDLTRNWLLPRSVHWAKDLFAVTWLRSRLGLEELAQALGRRMDAQHEDGTELLLRLADARVLHPLPQHLAPQQRAALFAPVDHWWYLDRDETLQAVTLDTPPSTSSVSLPVRLTQAQLGALIDAAEPDTVLMLLDKAFPDALTALSRPERYRFVVQHIAKARELGMEASMDFATYCAISRMHGEQFFKQPPWQGLVKKVTSGQTSWAQALTSGEIDR